VWHPTRSSQTLSHLICGSDNVNEPAVKEQGPNDLFFVTKAKCFATMSFALHSILYTCEHNYPRLFTILIITIQTPNSDQESGSDTVKKYI